MPVIAYNNYKYEIHIFHTNQGGTHMEYWSLITEILSFLLLVILIFNLNYKRRVLTPTVKCFWAGLFLTAFCIVWNIFCTLLLSQGGKVPYGLNVFANTVYFILVLFSASVIALFVFQKMLEHVYDRHCMRRATRLLAVLTLLYTAAVFLNLKFHFLFWFDQEGNYHRGPFNAMGYGVVAAELVMMYICYFRHRVSISKEMKRTIRLFPPVVLALILLQIANPELLLNGIIAAFVEVILFLGFHSQKMGYDSITGLGNRTSFFSDLELRAAGKQHYQVFLITLVNFNGVNNRFGYQTANEFLYAVASWLEALEKNAAVYRYIGVTYAVIMPYTTEEQSKSCRDRIQQRFQDNWILGKDAEKLQAVFGNYVSNGELQNANHVMEALDYMLTLMKRSEQIWVRFDDEIFAQMMKRRKISQLLKDTVNRQAFEVWYQPLYCWKTQRFCSAEALVRMKNEKGEYVSPAEFIPIAETSGMIDDIFWLVLKRVCEFLSSGRITAMDSISINLSMTQLENPELDQQILTVIGKYGLSPSQVKFEITEQQLANNPVIVGDIVRKMLHCGFQFYLDDFGIGYSNVSAVAMYNFEFIKLDKSFMGDVLTDSKSSLLVQNLVRMFHDLGMGVVAEGVETREQLDYLVSLGVEKIQGFYYARPMDGEKLEIFLRETAINKKNY